MFYIYEIKNNINNKTYIGQHKTNNLQDSKRKGRAEMSCFFIPIIN